MAVKQGCRPVTTMGALFVKGCLKNGLYYGNGQQDVTVWFANTRTKEGIPELSVPVDGRKD